MRQIATDRVNDFRIGRVAFYHICQPRPLILAGHHGATLTCTDCFHLVKDQVGDHFVGASRRVEDPCNRVGNYRALLRIFVFLSSQLVGVSALLSHLSLFVLDERSKVVVRVVGIEHSLSLGFFESLVHPCTDDFSYGAVDRCDVVFVTFCFRAGLDCHSLFVVFDRLDEFLVCVVGVELHLPVGFLKSLFDPRAVGFTQGGFFVAFGILDIVGLFRRAFFGLHLVEEQVRAVGTVAFTLVHAWFAEPTVGHVHVFVIVNEMDVRAGSFYGLLQNVVHSIYEVVHSSASILGEWSLDSSIAPEMPADFVASVIASVEEFRISDIVTGEQCWCTVLTIVRRVHSHVAIV